MILFEVPFLFLIIVITVVVLLALLLMPKWIKWPKLTIVLLIFFVMACFFWKEHIQECGFEAVKVGDTSEKIINVLGKPSTILLNEGYCGNKLGQNVSEWCYYDPIIGGVEVISFRILKNHEVLSKYRYQSP